MSLERLKALLESEEGKKQMIEHFAKIKQKEETKLQQIDRLHIKNGFLELIEKAIIKYDSDKYRKRWYDRGIEPPEDLFWFLFEYASKYGRECTPEEVDIYSNMFTGEIYYCQGFYLQVMYGQGSAIRIDKES